jgi:hypothetical protein
LDNYINKVQDLLSNWDPKRFFKVNNMQKLVGKLTRLGEGAPWIFKLMLHLYTSLAFALKSNTKLLEKSSSGFRDLVKQITTKTFTGKISDHQRHINFAMKKSCKNGEQESCHVPHEQNDVRRVEFYFGCTKTGFGYQIRDTDCSPYPENANSINRR